MLELQRIKKGISWFESKIKINKVSVTPYLHKPVYELNHL
jgi:hypothetical protein